MAPISLGFRRPPRLQEFFHATALSRVAFFAAIPGKADLRCGILLPTSFPGTPDTVPGQCSDAVAPAREILRPAENAGRSFATGRTRARCRVESDRVGMRLARPPSVPSFSHVYVGSVVGAES